MSNAVRAVFPLVSGSSGGIQLLYKGHRSFNSVHVGVGPRFVGSDVWVFGMDGRQMRFAWSLVTILASGDRWRCCKTHRLGVDSGVLPVLPVARLVLPD